MDYGREFEKYATKHQGISSTYYNQLITNMTPNIIEERQLNAVSMDVFSRLMMDRIIFLGTGINDQVANIIQAQLLFLESVDSSKDISIYINSPGGGVYAGLGIYDTPHSRVMIHQPLGGAQGQASDIEITAREIMKLKDELYQIIAKHSGQTVEKVHDDSDRDYWMKADEAKAYGMIDEVLVRK